MLSTGEGCWVRNQSIDFHTITTSTQPKIHSAAERRARWVGSSMARRIMTYAAKISTQTSAEVSRASQVHQMPQITRAQMLPVTILTSEKMTETSTTEAASES